MSVVFPSSTSRDLHGCRAAVLEACRAFNLGIATMDGFAATGHGAVSRYSEQLRAVRLSQHSRLAEVAAAIWLIEETLPGEVRLWWHELAVLVGDFEAGWAAAVWGVDEETADDWLGVLRRNSLIEWKETTKEYRLHDLVRECADAALAESERLAAQRRHAQHSRAVLEEADDLYVKGGEGVVAAMRQFDRAWTNAEAAWAWVRQ